MGLVLQANIFFWMAKNSWLCPYLEILKNQTFQSRSKAMLISCTQYIHQHNDFY